MCVSFHWELDLRSSGSGYSNLQVPGILEVYMVSFLVMKSEARG